MGGKGRGLPRERGQGGRGKGTLVPVSAARGLG